MDITNKLLIISNSDVHELIDREHALKIITDTYLLHNKGLTILPHSIFLKLEKGNRIIGLPAYLNGELESSGIKWVSSFPENVDIGLHRAISTLILNDITTGYPYCIINGSFISLFRTTCSAYLALNFLISNKTIRQLGIIGTGELATSFLECINTFKIISLTSLLIYDINLDHSKKFAKNNGYNETIIANNVEDVIKTSDVILFATTAATPHIENLALFSHNPIVLNISLRDIGVQIILSSNNIVDDVNHVNRENTSINLAYQNCSNTDFINGTIAQLLTDQLNLDQDKPIIVSPFGLGILDLAIGQSLYNAAISKRKGFELLDFF